MSRNRFEKLDDLFMDVVIGQYTVSTLVQDASATGHFEKVVAAAYFMRGELTAEQAENADFTQMHMGFARSQYWLNGLESGRYDPETLLSEMIEQALVGQLGENADAVTRNQQIGVARELSHAIRDPDATFEDLIAIRDRAYEDFFQGEAPSVPDVEGRTFTLTQNADRVPEFMGTSRSDLFDAPITTVNFQNGNTLNTGDVLDGNGGSSNKLVAHIINDAFVASGLGAVRPTTKNIQNVEITALATENENEVRLDASRMEDIEHIGSYNSNASLVIQDLNTRNSEDGTKRFTDEITFRMDHTSNQNTGGGASDLTVYFDENYLIERIEGDLTEIYFEMMNTNAHRAGHDPLVSVFIRRMEFDVNGQLVKVHEHLDGEEFESTGENITTYQQLVNALYTVDADGNAQGALPDALEAAGLERDAAIARLGGEFSFFDGDTGEMVVGDHQIVIEATPGNTVSHVNAELEVAQTESRAEVNGERIDNWSRHERVDFDVDPGDQELKTTIELHKVGRGSDGGNVLIGGKSQSATSKGIPVFDVHVLGGDDKPSNIGWLATTNSDLETVNIRSVNYNNRVNEDGNPTWADLTIRDGFSPQGVAGVAAQNSLDLVDARGFNGHLVLGRNLTQERDYDGNDPNTPEPVVDGNIVANEQITRNVLNLHNLQGNGASSTELFGTINRDGVYSYRSSTDDIAVEFATSTSVDFRLDTGVGNDVIVARLNGEAVNSLGEWFEIDAGSGDNFVNVRMTDGVSLRTMEELGNLHITTGSGRDTVIVNGHGTFDINTGGGSDLIIIQSADRSGLERNYSDRYEVEGFAAENGSATMGSWIIGDPTGPQTWGTGGEWNDAGSARVLYKAKLTLSFAGIEETVEIDTDRGGNFIAHQADINNAIKDAIDSNAELSKLLRYSDSTGNQALEIEALIGGLNNLAIVIYQPRLEADAVNLAEDLEAGRDVLIEGGDVSALRQGLIETGFRDSTSDHLEDASDIAARTSSNGFHGSVDEEGVGDNNTYSTIQYSHDNADQVDNGYGAGEDIFSENDYFWSGGVFSGSDDTMGYSESIINAGTGAHNVVVMHSNPLSSNTLVIDGSMGANDKVTVVNWHTRSPESVSDASHMGRHALDFSAFLSDEDDPSSNIANNTQSASLIEPTANIVNNANAFTNQSPSVSDTDGLARPNSVNVIRFQSDVDDTFAGLDGATLVRALNNADNNPATSNYGNLNAGLLTPTLGGSTPVNSTLNHIIMVENDRNEGEYKVFHVTSTWDVTNNRTTTQGDGNNNLFNSNVNELGTLDFGASINVMLAGSVAHTNYLVALREAVDAAGGNVWAVQQVAYDSNGDGNKDQIVDNPGYAPGVPEPYFSVAALNVPRGVEFEEGEDSAAVTINGTVQNTGHAEGTQEITLTVGDDEIDTWTWNETLDAGDTFDIPETVVNLGEGTYEVRLSTGDHSMTRTVEVGEEVDIAPDRHVHDVVDGEDLDADDIAAENNMDAVSFAFPEPALPGDSVFIENFNEGDQLDFSVLGLDEFSEEYFDFTTRSETTNTVRVRVGEDVDNFDAPSWFVNLVGVENDVFSYFQDFQDEAIDAGQLIEQVGVAINTEDWLVV
ncbi:hypothetical protein CKO15_08485 [Halorhodospira abdelmalekii]|uniref:hypothetical protein n=1 Tax=Halorhodospira abdelmalekii TaxID=421629 RepID=UPI00190754E7|nr:hypothetical protein [Halorhodospira abdelmalekii]MBK1735319.1 hypothetical protein [Halorhodospira abdelmalekii]